MSTTQETLLAEKIKYKIDGDGALRQLVSANTSESVRYTTNEQLINYTYIFKFASEHKL